MDSTNTLNKTLLFIPDISGFTKFLNETEIVHGVHIISELLEIIIKENTMGLKVAEIEGDAVLFYKYTEQPTLKELYEQCKEMFLAFHQHIKLYERDRICECGSCSGTPNLTLKFIVHYGDVIERNILGHFQLMGADVTTAHKLMKNNLDTDEYILISESSILKNDTSHVPSWFKLQNGSMHYDDVGEVNYKYEKFTELRNEIPELPPRKKIMDEPVQFTITYSMPHSLEATFKLLSSLERKHEWIEGVKKINFDETKIERIGTTHECVTPLNKLHIETTRIEKRGDTNIFGEEADAVGIFPAANQLYSLTKKRENECEIRLEVRFKTNLLNTLIFKNLFKSGLTKSLTKLERVLTQDKSNSQHLIG